MDIFNKKAKKSKQSTVNSLLSTSHRPQTTVYGSISTPNSNSSGSAVSDILHPTSNISPDSESSSPLTTHNSLPVNDSSQSTVHSSQPTANSKQATIHRSLSNSKSNSGYSHPAGHKYLGHSHNPLSPFLYHPDRAEFLNRETEEKVILIVRKHPITNIRWMLTAVGMLFVPAFFSVFSFFETLTFDYRLVLSIVWYLILFAFVFEEFLMWFFHVNIITDERIIEVDFVNIFFREMTDANIDQVQDVTVELGGGLRTFFNYGNVIIQTAAEVPRITFESVPKPDMVAKILRELRVEEEQEKLEGRVR